MKLLGWIQRKQNERRCRAQGFRPKLCQAMRWKEENDRIGQLLDSEFSSPYSWAPVRQGRENAANSAGTCDLRNIHNATVHTFSTKAKSESTGLCEAGTSERSVSRVQRRQ